MPDQSQYQNQFVFEGQITEVDKRPLIDKNTKEVIGRTISVAQEFGKEAVPFFVTSRVAEDFEVGQRVTLTGEVYVKDRRTKVRVLSCIVEHATASA